MNIYFNNIMVCQEIHRLHSDGFSISKIGEILGLDRRTVGRHQAMEQGEFDRYLLGLGCRMKILDGYEDFVFGKLRQFLENEIIEICELLMLKNNVN